MVTTRPRALVYTAYKNVMCASMMRVGILWGWGAGKRCELLTHLWFLVRVVLISWQCDSDYSWWLVVVLTHIYILHQDQPTYTRIAVLSRERMCSVLFVFTVQIWHDLRFFVPSSISCELLLLSKLSAALRACASSGDWILHIHTLKYECISKRTNK